MSNIVEWRDANDSSKYPFSESCTLISSAHQWSIPDGLFADAQIRLPHGVNTAELISIVRTGGGIMGTIVSGAQTIGTFEFTVDDLDGGAVPIVDTFGINRGFLVAGISALRELDQMPEGLISFASGRAVFEGSVVFQYPETILQSITISNEVLYGRIVLVEGPGIVMTKEGTQTIRIDAIGLIDDVTDCARLPIGAALRTINTVSPNSQGVFGLEARGYYRPMFPESLRQILKIVPSGNTLTFSIAK